MQKYAKYRPDSWDMVIFLDKLNFIYASHAPF